MPIVEIRILEGRDPRQIAGLIAGVTDVVAEQLQVDKEQVRVLVSEIPPSHWGVGGIAKNQRR